MKSRGFERRQVLAALCALGVATSPLVHAAASAAPCSLADGIDPAALRELAALVAPAASQLASDAALANLERELAAADFVARLGQRVMDDYAHDRVLALGDWRVSHTEATLYVALNRCG